MSVNTTKHHNTKWCAGRDYLHSQRRERLRSWWLEWVRWSTKSPCQRFLSSWETGPDCERRGRGRQKKGKTSYTPEEHYSARSKLGKEINKGGYIYIIIYIVWSISVHECGWGWPGHPADNEDQHAHLRRERGEGGGWVKGMALNLCHAGQHKEPRCKANTNTHTHNTRTRHRL